MWKTNVQVTGKIGNSSPAVSERGLLVAGMFGIGVEDCGPRELFPPTGVAIESGQVILITGGSGGGKSTLLRAIERALEPAKKIARLEEIDIPAKLAVVDCF